MYHLLVLDAVTDRGLEHTGRRAAANSQQSQALRPSAGNSPGEKIEKLLVHPSAPHQFHLQIPSPESPEQVCSRATNESYAEVLQLRRRREGHKGWTAISIRHYA